ncbi:MAG TPA: cache domain-containing protein, partial [Burkholderiaceae bacterium]|nr:cache domain-containing protein [Burkholderiaceae bacterium]
MNPRLVFFARLSRLATFSRGLVVGFVALNALVLALSLISVQRDRADHRNRAAVATQNLAQLLQTSLDASLERADRALLTLKDEIERQVEEGGIDNRMLNDFYARAFSHQIDFDSLQVADVVGDTIQLGGRTPVAQDSVAQRDFFITLRDDPRTTITFAKTALSKSYDETGVVIARRLVRRTGEFAGVVYAVLGANRLHDSIAGLDLGSNGLVALRDLDLGLLVRHPRLLSADAAADPRAVSSAFRQLLYANRDFGTFTSKNGFDGIERTNTYRKLSGYPYYVIVGLSTDDYLQGWRRESATTLALAAGFALVTFVLSEQLRRFWTRREAAVALLAKQEA